MEVLSLFEAEAKKGIIDRLNKLTSQSPAQWGKMDAAQMLAHCQQPMAVALDGRFIKGNWLMKLILPLFKKIIYGPKPFKRDLPTEKTFIMTGQSKDFEKEKTALLDMVTRFTEANIVSDKHPIFGKLTREQWSKATWKHLDHHLQQFGV